MADITVQVSSPGLVAYGSSSWGSESYGGFDQIDLTVGSVDAFNSSGWGRLTWGSLVWGLDYEDVTVSLTTPGTPTTWGYSTWGYGGYGQITGTQIDQGEELATISVSVSLSTNLINTTTGIVFAAANFIEIPSGVVLNTTVNSVFAGESIVVEVTTPGSPTTWGESTWGSNSWNEVNGVVTLQGDETIDATQNPTITLTGNQLNTTVASLAGELQGTTWGYQTWGSNAWAQTTAFIFGDSNVTASTNLLNTSTGTVNWIENRVVEVTSPGDLAWGLTEWGYGSWGNIGGLDVEQGGEEVVVPSIEVDVSGITLTLTLTSVAQITGDANVTPNTNLLTVSLGNEDATPNTQVTLSTNLMTLSQGFASGETLSTISVTGVTVTSQVGRVFVSAWAVIDIGVTNTWSVVDIAA